MQNDRANANVEQGSDPPVRRIRLRPLITGLVVGCGLTIVIALALLFIFARSGLPLLTQAALTAAIQRWNERGPDNYRLEIRVLGERSGLVALEVRHGEPVSLVRDGRAPARHTWDFWTVPGQFEAIEGELTGDPQAMFGVPDHSQVIQRAEFDAELGYPRKYQRSVLGKSYETGWEVLKFEALK